MKKLTIIATVAMLCPLGAQECRADYKDMASQVETVADFWIGGYGNDSKSSTNGSLADDYGLPEAATRVGGQRATEFYSTKSSASGGFLIKAAPLPNRLHLEFDYYNDNDWFGDFRQSYKDYFQIRFLPRRFVHNLDNLTVFDFNPANRNYNPAVPYAPDPLDPSKGTTPFNTNGNDVEIHDALVDNYSLKVDIDQYRLRLKTPNFPLHFYQEGEFVSRTGLQQMRFVGGTGITSGSSANVSIPVLNADGSPKLDASGNPVLQSVTPIATSRGRVRVTESRAIDQESKEFTFGANAHLGFVEVDMSNKTRKFRNDAAVPVYDYDLSTAGAVTGETISRVHNVIPELKASTNSFRIHTSHTGRIVASATYTEVSKTNEYSGAKAENDLAYGEVTWLPVGYLSIVTKVRHQKNDASAPESVSTYDSRGVLTNYLVKPGVASKTDTGSVAVRYSLVPKTNLSFIYNKKVKKVDDISAFDWSRPVKQTSDVYEVGFTNWALPKVRLTGKLIHTHVGTDLQPLVVDGVTGASVMNNEPEQTNQGNLGLTWSVTPKLTAFLNATAAKEKTQDNRTVEASNVQNAEALREQYLASFSYRINDKIAITPTYTYMSLKQQRDLPLGSTVDTGYTNVQKAQNLALNLMFVPITRLSINTSVDYTITKGNYNPTSPLTVGTAVNADLESLAMFSETHSEEINVRMDGEYDLGRGWGLGLDLRYVDWKDTSIDNPSNGTFYGGLFKVTKKLFY